MVAYVRTLNINYKIRNSYIYPAVVGFHGRRNCQGKYDNLFIGVYHLARPITTVLAFTLHYCSATTPGWREWFIYNVLF